MYCIIARADVEMLPHSLDDFAKRFRAESAGDAFCRVVILGGGRNDSKMLMDASSLGTPSFARHHEGSECCSLGHSQHQKLQVHVDFAPPVVEH